MKTAPALRSAFRFFLAHAGYVGGKRAVGALSLARSEAAARSLGLVFEWADDPDADWSWMSEDELSEDHEVYSCTAYRVCPECGHKVEVVASLCGIFDPSPEYRRVIEAELASEAL